MSQSFSKKTISLLFLTALAVSVVATPVRLAAQETAPAAAAKSEAAKPEAAKTQEEQEQALRLEGPVMKAASKAFNLSPETTASIFEFLNFGILVLLVGIPLARIAPKVFRKRGQDLQMSLTEARKATEEAHGRLAAIEAKLAGLDTEIAAIRSQVEEDSLSDEARIKASIEEEKQRIVASAEQEISATALRSRRELQNFAVNLAIEQAAQHLVLTPETDRALIAEFIKGTATDLGKGGQN